jgi:hypothetical protein
LLFNDNSEKQCTLQLDLTNTLNVSDTTQNPNYVRKIDCVKGI